MIQNPADQFVDSPPEVEIAFDMVKRSLPVAPVMIILSGLIWGFGGAVSCALGLALVLVNFVLAAGMLAGAAKISVTALMAATLGGFFVRMGLIATVLYFVKSTSWVAMFPLLFTILVTHLGLLLWETRFVSANLAYPALKPARKGA
jgi:hypothetical protein